MNRILFFPLFAFPILIFTQEKKTIDSTSIQNEIKEITISGKKKLIERKIDRIVFNVEQSVAAQGGDAMDALKVIPNVRIAGENISIIGKNSVRVMVNDKLLQISGEELQSYLKSIPTANIQKIEVITNPNAKYDAEGNSGLINILLKETKEDNWNATLRSTYQQATYERLTHGVGLSYQKNKFSAMTNINYTYGNRLYTNNIRYHYPSELWKYNMFYKTKFNTLSSLINLNYTLTPKSSLGFQFLGYFSDNKTFDTNNNYAHHYTNHSLLKYYKTEGNSFSKPNNISLNLNYNHKLDDNGKKFSIDADYFTLKSDRDNYFTSDLQNFNLHQISKSYTTNFSIQHLKNYSLKTDWELPYHWANLSFGAKINSTETQNKVAINFFDRDTLHLNESINDHFQYTENTQALYLSANKKFGKKWEAKAGLRGEYTQTKAQSISLNQTTNRDYFKLFPTFYLSYNTDDNHTFSVQYGRRIGRPAFWQLNPSREYDGNKSYTTGNPFLQPSFTDNYEIGYSYKSLLNASLFFSKNSGIISQVARHNTQEDSQIFRHENSMNSLYSGGNISLTFSPMKFWETNISINATYAEANPYNLEIYAKKYSGWEGTTSFYNTLNLNKSKTFSASFNYWYTFPSKGMGLSGETSSLDIGFRYLALDKKLTIGLNFEDIFRSSESTFHTTDSGINQYFTQYYDSQLVRLSLVYKFGNDKISLKQRTTGNEEERNRAN